jgi:hypothetical protein
MKIRALTETDAEAVATWRYPGRYQTYDVSEVVTSEAGFWAVEREATFVGYCCFGHEARVPGAVEEAGILDIGYGMRPDLMARVWVASSSERSSNSRSGVSLRPDSGC